MKAQHPLFLSVLLALGVTAHAQDNAPPAPAAAPTQSETQKWIATTDAQWQATFKRDVTDVREAELTKVKEQYRTSLEAAIAKASTSGDLDGAVVLRNEQERFVDTKTIPELDLATEAAPVKQLRAPVRIALTKLEKDHATRVRALHAKYDQLLAQAQTQLTQRQRLDDALEVKAKRDEVAAAWITPALLVEAKRDNVAAIPKEVPIIPRVPDNLVGKWTIRWAGQSRVREIKADGTCVRLESGTSDEPDGTWRVSKDKLVISWRDGGVDTWLLPLKPSGKTTGHSSLGFDYVATRERR